MTFSSGSYTLAEPAVSGYTASSWGGDCAANGTITLVAGDNKTCTIINTDNTPQLKPPKDPQNNDGGTLEPKDRTLSAAAAPKDGRNFSNKGGAGFFQTVFANAAYVLAKSGPDGCSASA